MRVRGVFRAADHPAGAADPGVAHLFDTLFAGRADAAFDADHVGIAIVAHHPAAALHLARLSRTLVLETRWSDRPDLRELAIATVNTHYASAVSLAARAGAAAAAGLSPAMLAAIPDAADSALFDDDQRRIVRYANAMLAGRVNDALSARMLAEHGEGAVAELAMIVAVWAAWAMLIEAMQPDPAAPAP